MNGSSSPGGLSGSAYAGVVRRGLLAALAALAVLGVAPALAGARVNWRLNGLPLSEAVATKGTGTLTLTEKFSILGNVGVKCEATTEGTAGPGALGTATKWTLSGCVPTAGCAAGTVTMEAVNLSWNTELLAAGKAVDEKLLSSGKGTPGFKWKCRAFGIQVEDTCTATLKASTANGSSGVTATFIAGEKLSCVNGENSGLVEGSNTIEAKSGGKLSAELEEPPLWRVNGVPIATATPVTWKGTVKVHDHVTGLGTLEVQCEDTGTGYAGVGTAGEMTSWTMSNCTPKAECTSNASIEALSLPWKTELYAIEGSVQGLINHGSVAGFKFKCKALGETVEDECLWVPPAILTNTASGVTAAYKEEFHGCFLGLGSTGQITGSQAIKTSTGLLSAS